MSANTPAFDRSGNMYISDTGSWSPKIDGHMYRIPPGGGDAEVWCATPIDTPNGIALDPEETFVYYVETWGASISPIAINKDGLPERSNAWCTCRATCRTVSPLMKKDGCGLPVDRPDKICVFDVETRRMEVFAEDWQGEALRGPCHVAFAGANREILLASSLDRATVQRFDNPGVRGVRLNNPKL